MSERASVDPASVRPSPGGQVSPVTLRAGENGPAVQGELFEQIGGSETFDRLVTAFYNGVQSDPVLWPMYPQHDLDAAIHRLSSFLQQYWGGPSTYSQERGHPRLRMRHVAFRVNPEARDRWLGHMRAALDTLELPPLQDATLWGYLDRAAHSLVNTFEV